MITHEIATKNKTNTKAKVRVHYNYIGVTIASGRKATRLRGYDMLDKSKQYYKSMAIAKTCDNTHYIKIKNTYIKLKDFKIELIKQHIKFYISSDYKYITRLDTMTTYNIVYTNKMAIEGHRRDTTIAKRLQGSKVITTKTK